MKVQPKKTKTAVTAKPVKKLAAKPPAKVVKKPVVMRKTVAKTKPALKAKPVVKAKIITKAIAKAVGKTKKPVINRAAPKAKAVAPTQSRVKIKVAAKPVPAKKTVTKAGSGKTTNTTKTTKTTKTAVKAVAKVIAKVAEKAKTVAKVAAKTMKVMVQAVPKNAAKPGKPVNPAKDKVAAKTAGPTAAPVPLPPVVALPLPPGTVVQKGGRPSARLQQITVPSMAQSVASTAAKASFTKDLPPLFTPAPIAAPKKDPKLANNWKSKPAEKLTDAELLAMPDSEYMNDKQMAAFRLKLVELKNGILNSASETTEHLRDDTVVVPDPADRATIEEEHALELRTRDRERKLLKKIEQSINRIDAGDYGYCDETGEVIGVGRLIARPTATLTLEAQQRRELKQKMFGD